MAAQRPRPLDALQSIMGAFKEFDRKLDKLQDDVKFHGHTLSELHLMVTNLAASGESRNFNPEVKHDESKRLKKKQQRHGSFDDRYFMEEPYKTNRKTSTQPLSNKLKIKGFQSQKYVVRSSNTDAPFIDRMIPGSRVPGKYNYRHRKAESPRKATTLRAQKIKEIKRSQKAMNE